MIREFASMVGKRWIKNGLISSEYYECYVYGIELIVSQILGISIILLLGAITGTHLNAVVFLVVFILVRQYTGGYHAGNYLSCNIIFSLSYIVNMLIVARNEINLFILVAFTFTIGIGTISIIGPCTHKNKRIEETLLKANKTKSLVLYVVCCLISVCIASSHQSLALTIVVTLLQIIILMIIGKIKEGS
ncbi:accessory gene regulator B family protein [Lachnospiraceae bacterium 54-53]